MQTKFPHLLAPYRIRDKVYKNRILMGPFTPPGAGEGYPNAMGYAWFETHARGGAAQITVGETAVDLEFGDRKAGSTVNIHAADMPHVIANRELTLAIARHGALPAIELSHIGMWNDPADIPGHQNPLGPSAFTRPDGVTVTEMTEAQIDAVCEQYADAACRAQNLGFDAIVIHGGHGWLQAQFLSPLFNRRTDRFGGSLENRARLSVMILERIRARVGEALLIEYRLSGDELTPGGFTIDDMAQVAPWLEPYVDLFHVSVGQYQDPVHTRTFPSIYEPHACNRDLSRRIKQAVSKPVAVVGAITDPETAEDVIASGDADFVVMVKQLIADPDYPRKLLEGRRDEIRPCIRCYNCMAGKPGTPPNLRCSVNPIATREHLAGAPVPPGKPLRVLVVGGGAAGLQAASTAALRGHSVTLVEKTDRLGGLLRFADFDPVKEDVRRLREQLSNMAHKLGVTVRLGVEATPAFVAGFAPDALITAVGASPVVPPIPGVERAVPGVEVYGRAAEFAGRTCVVIGGGLVGCETGVYLADAGASVTIVEMADEIAPECVGLYRPALLGRMEQTLRWHTGLTCTAVTEDAVVVRDKAGAERTLPADVVVCAAGMRANWQLADALNAAVLRAVAVGDCVKARQIREAVTEGHFAALDL